MGISENAFWVSGDGVFSQPELCTEPGPHPLQDGSQGLVRRSSATVDAQSCTDRGYETRTVSFPYCVSMNRPRLAILQFPRGSGRAVGSINPRSYKPSGVQLTTATVGEDGDRTRDLFVCD